MDREAARAFFEGDAQALRLFEAVADCVEGFGDGGLKVSKSQIAFRRARNFAMVWRPAQYLGRGAPLVLTVLLRRRDRSSRWKEVVEPAPGRFTHHLELRDVAEVDDEVEAWLTEAWQSAR